MESFRYHVGVTWLDGYERRIVASKRGRDLLGYQHRAAVTKLVLHTTEGPTAGSAWHTYCNRAGLWSGIHPHLTVDPATGVRWQHIALDRAGYALRWIDRSGCIQVEIVGRAADPKPASWYRWIVEHVVNPVCAAVPAIPAVCPVEFHDSAAYGLRGVARLSRQEWDATAGIVGHQHAPRNTHWDPGPLDLGLFRAAIGAQTGDAPSAECPVPARSAPWWADELAEAVDAGITDGSRPTDTATRAEAAIMALRASKA